MRVHFKSFWPGHNAGTCHLAALLRRRWDVEAVSSAADLCICSVFGDIGPDKCPSIFYSAEPTEWDHPGFDLRLTFDRDESGNGLHCPNHCVHVDVDADEAVTMRDSSPGWYERWGVDYIYRHNLGMRSSALRVLGAAGEKIRSLSEDQRGLIGFAGKAPLQRTTRWSIAMEKFRKPGYVSEKIMDALLSGAVPIYHGDLGVGLDFNEAAFIHIRDKSELAALPELLTRDRWEACRAAPMFPDGKPPPCWDRDRLLNAIEEIL